MKAINLLVLLLSLLCADNVQMQRCGKPVNQYRERINMQGPPGKAGPAAEIDYGRLTQLIETVVKLEIAKLKSEVKSEIEEMRSDITMKMEKTFSESDKRTKSRIKKVFREIKDLTKNERERNSTTGKAIPATDTKLENIRSEMTAIRIEVEKVATKTEKDLAKNARELNSTVEKIQTAVDTKLGNIRSEMAETRTEFEKAAAETAKEMATMKSEFNTKIRRVESEMRLDRRRIQAEADDSEATKESIKSGLNLRIAAIPSDVKSNNKTIRILLNAMADINNIKTASEAKTLAETYDGKKQHIRAIALYYAAGKLDKSRGDDGVEYKQWRVQDIREVVENMTDEDEVLSAAKFLAIPLMEELLEELRNIRGASHKLKVEYQAWCLNHIAVCYSLFDDYRNDFKNNVEAINLMKRKLGKLANKYRILGLCLNNAALAAWDMRDYTKSLSYFKQAVDVYQSASDLSEAERQENIIRIKNNINTISVQLEFGRPIHT